MLPEEIPEFLAGQRRQEQRREQFKLAGVSPDDIGSAFGDECGYYAHDFENILWPEMSFGRELKDHLQRWPSRCEIRAAVQAAIDVSQRETPAAPGCRTSIGDITSWAVTGDTHDRGRRDAARQHWRAMRLERWQELTSSKHAGTGETQVTRAAHASA